jgi:hypothetical protein
MRGKCGKRSLESFGQCNAITVQEYANEADYALHNMTIHVLIEISREILETQADSGHTNRIT